MENPKEKLLVKGSKCNLQFSTAEKDYFERACGFTDEELEIFQMRARGFSVLKISFEMERIHGKEVPGGQYSISKVERRIRSIKDKILKVL